jgi:tetratricopeptide (TPR) repeat protein
LTLVGLAIATVAAFAGVLRADWIYFDDPVYVVNNVHIARGVTLEGLQWVFRNPHGGNFHPLTSVSHMLDVELFGLDPRGPHAVNLALHTANAVLLCIVLARYTGHWWRSAIVAGLFALHPLRVESVAWISERKDVLSTLFFILSLEAYRRWTMQPGRLRYVLLCFFFVLGLLSKPMLVTLPFVLLLLDVWPLGRMTWPLTRRTIQPLIREKWPLFAISLVSSVVTYVVQQSAGAVMSSQTLPLGPRLTNALAAYGRYLWATIWPRDLAVYYPHTGHTQVERALASAVILLLITVFAWKARSRLPSSIVGWTWFVGTLVPVIGIVQVGSQSFADRYTYIPSVGLLLAAVWSVTEAVKKSKLARTTVLSATIGVGLVSGIATARQVSYWKDTRTLFTRALEVTDLNAVAHQNLGNALLLGGEVDAAIVHLEEALRIVPDFPDAHNNLGSALANQRRFEEAIAHFRAALRTADTAGTRYNLGFALVQAGRGDEALVEYERALELDPHLANARAALGASLAARGRLGEAETHLRRALHLAPDNVEAHRSMAITYTMQGRIEAGIDEYREVLKRAPKDLDALNNIAWIRATHQNSNHRDARDAVRLAEEACRIAPEENHVLFSTLAAARAEAGLYKQAVESIERAMQLSLAAGDSDANARYSLQAQHYRANRPFHQ